MSRKCNTMPLCDYLPERLPNMLRHEALRVTEFGGLCAPYGGGKVLAEGINLSPRKAPLLASRHPRGLFAYGWGSGRPHGIIFFDGVLFYARGTELFYTPDGVTAVSLGTVSDTDKSFFVFGDRLYIFPDKLYMERGMAMPRPIELDTGVIEQAEFRGNVITLPQNCIWTELGFGPGDGLWVINADDVNPAPEGYYRIEMVNGRQATLKSSFAVNNVSNAHFRRVVPDFEKCCVNGDRVYGIVGRDIYISGAGSATDFYSRSVGDGGHPVHLHSNTEGDFTALSAWQSYVVFFKSDRICKLLGNRSDSFVLSDNPGVGIPKELADTLCEAGNALYYASNNGVYRYRGQEPERIAPMGEETVQGGCGGTDGYAYYLVTGTASGKRLSLFIPDREEWYTEDCSDEVFLLRQKGFLFMQDGNGRVWKIASDGRSTGCSYDERRVRGSITASATLVPDRYGEPEGYRLVGLSIRATGETGGRLRVFASYSDGSASIDAERSGEILLGEFSGGMQDRILYVPLVPRPCDGMVLRLEMVGDWIVHAINRAYERRGQ